MMNKSMGEEIRDMAVLKWVADRGDKTLSLEHELDADSLVVDFGGYTGEWAQKIFDRYGCNIEIHEPTNEFAKHIEDRFSNAPKGKITVKENALGLGDYRAHLTVDGLATRIDRDAVVNHPNESTISVVDASKAIGKRKIDLLKMNIEGSEYEVFDSFFETGVIENIEAIFVQFHPIDDESIDKYNSIVNRLSETHMNVFRYPFIWEKWVKSDR